VGEGLRGGLQGQRIFMPILPMGAQVMHHAHRLKNFGVAQFALQVRTRLSCRLACSLCGRHGVAMAEPCQCHLHHGKKDCQPAQHRMQQKQDRDIDGRPGRIEERKNTIAREELTNLDQVAKGPRRSCA